MFEQWHAVRHLPNFLSVPCGLGTFPSLARSLRDLLMASANIGTIRPGEHRGMMGIRHQRLDALHQVIRAGRRFATTMER